MLITKLVSSRRRWAASGTLDSRERFNNNKAETKVFQQQTNKLYMEGRNGSQKYPLTE
jgi:hypothetical protein